jgi:hypothetical protein
LPAQRSRLVRGGGALGSENAGMSSVRDVSKRPHRMAEVSAARFILGGLVGPKPRPKGVGDGQTVDIPLPLVLFKSQVCAGRAKRSVVLELLRLSAQRSSTLVVELRGAGKSQGNSAHARLQEKQTWGWTGARTANRHWWPGINVPRWTSDPSLRN